MVSKSYNCSSVRWSCRCNYHQHHINLYLEENSHSEEGKSPFDSFDFLTGLQVCFRLVIFKRICDLNCYSYHKRGCPQCMNIESKQNCLICKCYVRGPNEQMYRYAQYCGYDQVIYNPIPRNTDEAPK